PPALPADHDDHDGGAPRRAAFGARLRHRQRAPPPAGDHDRRRAPAFADPDSVYDAGHLSLYGQARAGGEAQAGVGAAAGGGGDLNISAPFIHRPVATVLLTLAICTAGAAAYFQLPVAPLPRVDFPTLSVSAGLPGASPETMASAVATPLERRFGRIAGLSEMTSASGLGTTSITLQFALDRDIDSAARDVQAAINAAGGEL